VGVEIRFPIEFVVEGTAVSLQNRGRRRRSLREWQARVREASRTALPDGHFAADGPIAVMLYYFPNAMMQGDIDNIVKPILDALSEHIYRTDHQVQRVLVQKFEPDNVFEFASPSSMLEAALTGRKPILYVRLSDNPFEDLI
jgi:crossover junction endodeoxyribonuclease RusA